MIYICYATANEKRFFLEDIDNLTRLARQPHGMPAVHLLIAISEVRPQGEEDAFFLREVQALFAGHSSICLDSIFFKPNAGRDFSSYAMMLRKVAASATAEDYVFFTNRSARGPYQPNWLQAFIGQYEKFPFVGLCGTTINLVGHPRRGGEALQPHVQSYNLLTQMKHMQRFVDDFPAEHENDRTRIIDEGEIGLSTVLLEAGLGITCMEWPDTVLRKGQPIPDALPRTDVKKSVKRRHAFYHRLYLKKKRIPPVSWAGVIYLGRYARKRLFSSTRA